jgi:hypothetical protein
MLLASHNGKWHQVQSVVATGRVEKVYNLRVSNWHTYFVGCDQWGFSLWAHNINCADVWRALGREGQTISEEAMTILTEVVTAIHAGRRNEAVQLMQRLEGVTEANARSALIRLPSYLPSNARTLDIHEVYRRLRDNNGIDPATASERLHRGKEAFGYPPDAELLFDASGNVYDPRTREWLFTLTQQQ